MGTMKKIFLGILILGLGHLIYFYGFRNIDNPRFDIFFQSKSFPRTHFSYFYFLGKIPPSYNKYFNESLIFKNKQCKLINIVRKHHPNYHNYIIFSNKNSKLLLKNSDSLYYKISGANNILSSQINLRAYNKYLKCANISDKEKIIDTFFYLFTTIGGDNSYKVVVDTLPAYLRIKNKMDLELIKMRKNKIKDSLFFDSDKFIFKKDKVYVWFKNFGIFQFNFEIKNNKIVSVTDRFLGYTGSEKW